MYIFYCKKLRGHPSVHGALVYLKNYFILQKYILQKSMLTNYLGKTLASLDEFVLRLFNHFYMNI